MISHLSTLFLSRMKVSLESRFPIRVSTAKEGRQDLGLHVTLSVLLYPFFFFQKAPRSRTAGRPRRSEPPDQVLLSFPPYTSFSFSFLIFVFLFDFSIPLCLVLVRTVSRYVRSDNQVPILLNRRAVRRPSPLVMPRN